MVLLSANLVVQSVFCCDSSPFTPPGNALLQQRSTALCVEEIKTEAIQAIIEQMIDIANGQRAGLEGRVMVGLAAPQIGILKRIILVDIGITAEKKEFGTLQVFINPEIISYSDEVELGREGCYSVKNQLIGQVPRSTNIQIQAYDREGNFIREELSGYTARIFQHEVDHLEGIRFPDRVGPNGLLHLVEKDEFSQYKESWETWPNHCSWDQWLAMKSGEE